MHRKAIGQLNLLQLRVLILNATQVVKLHGHCLFIRVNPGNKANIAVENPHAFLAIRRHPGELVVVFDLDNLVALPQDKLTKLQFTLPGGWGIQRFLQHLIETGNPAYAFLGRG